MVDSKMKKLLVSMGVLTLIVGVGGCATYRPSAALAERPRTLTKEDVVNMATSDIGDDVIIAQIDATGSRFRLCVSDITQLKDAGVSETVIEHMISTGKEYDQEPRCLRYTYYPHWWVTYHYYPPIRVGLHAGYPRRYYWPARGGWPWLRARR